MTISNDMEDLIYKILAKEANEEEREMFNTWLRGSDEHQVFFQKIEQAWYTGKYAAEWEKVKMSRAWEAIEKQYTRRRRRHFWKIGWGAAAVFVSFICVMFLMDRRTSESMVEVPVGKPGEAKALLVLSSGVKVELDNQVGDTIQENGLPILNEDNYIDYSQSNDDVQIKNIMYNELIVPVSGEYRLVLSDGTIVYMNSESKLRYPVKFVGDKRIVELEGEAYFDVSHDEQHPFVVHTEQLCVNVLGTSFNVMAYKQDARTEVTLVNGKVDVESGNINEMLTPNLQFVMNNMNREYQVRHVNVSTYVDWKSGILNFDAMPLEELGDKLGRWYGMKFFFSKESLKYLKFSGAFKKYNDINYILSLIEATTNVSFKINDDVVVVNEK